MTTPTYILDHPIFPKDIIDAQFAATKLATPKPTAARTKRQKEYDKIIGKKLQYTTSRRQLLWRLEPTLPDLNMLKVPDKALAYGLTKNLVIPNFTAAAWSADGNKEARVIEQGAHNMYALEALVDAIGVPRSALAYDAFVQTMSGGHHIEPAAASGFTNDAPVPATLRYLNRLTITRILPEFRAALLKMGFKEQEPLIRRPGFISGLVYYDGGISIRVSKTGRVSVQVSVCHDQAAYDEIARLLGKPGSYILKGNGVGRSAWGSKQDVKRVIEVVHNNLGGAMNLLNPRKHKLFMEGYAAVS